MVNTEVIEYVEAKKQAMRESIKDVIYGKFQTETACAAQMGWPRQRLNKITQGKKEPSVSEIGQIALTTGVDYKKIVEIFLTYWLPDGQFQ